MRTKRHFVNAIDSVFKIFGSLSYKKNANSQNSTKRTSDSLRKEMSKNNEQIVRLDIHVISQT